MTSYDVSNPVGPLTAAQCACRLAPERPLIRVNRHWFGNSDRDHKHSLRKGESVVKSHYVFGVGEGMSFFTPTGTRGSAYFD